jgi:hypothetical protein
MGAPCALPKTSSSRAAYLRAQPGSLLCNIHRILFLLSVAVVLYTYSYRVVCRDRLDLEDLEESIDEERSFETCQHQTRGESTPSTHRNRARQLLPERSGW